MSDLEKAEPQGGEGNPQVAADGGSKAPDSSKAATMIAKYGSAEGAVLTLMGENYKAREELRDLKARLPKDGSVVLEGDDARHWSTYRQFGTPGDLKKALDAGKQHEAEAAGFRKAETVRSAAEVLGFKPGVLATLARDLEIEIGEDRGKDGKPVRTAVVKGDGESRTPLAEYAEAHWADFLPSLRAEAEKARPVGTPAAARPKTVPAGNGRAGRRVPGPSF